MPQTITLEKFYPYPLERVWYALTSPQALAVWLMENDFEPRLGHLFQLQSRLEPKTTIYCEVIALEPPTQLAYTWREQWMNQPSIVTWELAASEAGTQLHLCHSGLSTETFSQEWVSPAHFWQGQSGQAQYDTQAGGKATMGLAAFELDFESEWESRLVQLAKQMLDLKDFTANRT